jgi:hypothetical protein
MKSKEPCFVCGNPIGNSKAQLWPAPVEHLPIRKFCSPECAMKCLNDSIMSCFGYKPKQEKT